MRTYDWLHLVTFEETNALGNAYWVHHLSWQGRCRESFLSERVPQIVQWFRDGLRLVTVRCSCEYFSDLYPLDRIVIRMSLKDLSRARMVLGFDYVRGEETVARGEQEIACMRADGER